MDDYIMDYEQAQLQAAADILNAFAEGDPNPEVFLDFVGQLSPKALAHLLLQFPLTAIPNNPESGTNKYLGVEVAEALGPDHAQALYHFAVLVTRLT